MCGTNQSKNSTPHGEEVDRFLQEFRAPSAYVLQEQHAVYSQFYDDGYRLYNFDSTELEEGKSIQEEEYFPKWGEYTINSVARLKDENAIHQQQLYIGFSTRFNARANVKYESSAGINLQTIKLRSPNRSELNITQNFIQEDDGEDPGFKTKQSLQNEEMVSLKMRDQSYTERLTYFNSFKKSNSYRFIDRNFPPEIDSIFVNYDPNTTEDSYVTHTNQRIDTSLIRTIVFSSVENLTPMKNIYLTE